MPIIQTRNSEQFAETLRDNAQKVFLISLIPTVALFGYLLYGLFTGQLADAAHGAKDAHVIQLIQQLSFWLNISLVITVISSIVLFWETESLGYIFLALGAFLAYGLDFSIKFLFGQDGAKLTSGPASQALLHEFWIAAMMIGAPGVAMVVRHIIGRIVDTRQAQDLTNVTYGKDVAEQQKRPQALIGAFAACWQLPFCRDGIRVRCPIYHAQTKCWKERVGCMCEENIILLAMGGEEQKKSVDMTADGAAAAPTNSGFVPIGDLITKQAETTRAAIPTRPGPRGVRLPDNPHLTDRQKRERCRNCIIYNEHQRQKYQLLSAPVTLSVPALVFWQFDAIRGMLHGLLNGLDSLIGHLSFQGGNGSTELTQAVSGNLPIEVLIIICFTLIAMTWAQRLLEYCVFKIKI